MPIYEYECESCSERFEVLQKISEPPLTGCSACQGRVRRLVSPSGLIFKGSGFYINDYARKNNEPSGSKGEKKPAASSGEKQKKETTAKPKPKK